MATPHALEEQLVEDYGLYRTAFQRHFQVYFEKNEIPFEIFDQAYELGYSLALDPELTHLYWDEISTTAQERWERISATKWQQINLAVKYSWKQIKNLIATRYSNHQFAFLTAGFSDHFTNLFDRPTWDNDDLENIFYLGYIIALDPKFNFHDWFEIEPDIKNNWGKYSRFEWDNNVSLILRSTVESVRRMLKQFEYPEFETSFRRHFHTHLAKPESPPYEWYEPAYQYGYDLASDVNNFNRSWVSMEKEFENRWKRNYSTPWEDVKDAVRHAWQELKLVYGMDEKLDPTFSKLMHLYNDRFQELGYPSDNLYEAGYRFGYFLAADVYKKHNSWPDMLPQVKNHWDKNPMLGGWDNFRLAAQDGWNEVQKTIKELIR